MSTIRHRLILTDPSTGEQVTTWLFGTTLETSAIARNDVVSGKQYCPRSQTRVDPQDGLAFNEPLIAAKQSTGESEHFTLNQQSEPVTIQDPNNQANEQGARQPAPTEALPEGLKMQ